MRLFFTPACYGVAIALFVMSVLVVVGWQVDTLRLRAQLTADDVVNVATRTAIGVGLDYAVGQASGQSVAGFTAGAAALGALTGQQAQLNVGGTPLPDCGTDNCFSIPTSEAEWGGIVRTKTLIETINYWVNFALGFLGLVAVAIIVWSGFLYVTSRGEDDQIGQAKKGIIYAILGIILITLAYAVVHTLIAKGTTGAEPVAAHILSID